MTKTKRPTNALDWQPLCPANPEHGRLLDFEHGFFCPHSGHNFTDVDDFPWFSPETVGAYDARGAQSR